MAPDHIFIIQRCRAGIYTGKQAHREFAGLGILLIGVILYFLDTWSVMVIEKNSTDNRSTT